MSLNHTLIITTFVFLVIMRLAAWIIATHRFQTLTFILIYFIAITPNLSALLTGPFEFSQLIMTFFDSIWIYILFSLYIGALLVMKLTELHRTRNKTIIHTPQTQIQKYGTPGESTPSPEIHKIVQKLDRVLYALEE